MIINKNHKDFGKILLLDAMNTIVHTCFAYNTKTKIASLYLSGKNSNKKLTMLVSNKEVVKIDVHLPDSKLVWKHDMSDYK